MEFLDTVLRGRMDLDNLISTSEDPIGLSGGTYTVIVTDSNGCTDTNVYTIKSVGGPSDD